MSRQSIDAWSFGCMAFVLGLTLGGALMGAGTWVLVSVSFFAAIATGLNAIRPRGEGGDG